MAQARVNVPRRYHSAAPIVLLFAGLLLPVVPRAQTAPAAAKPAARAAAKPAAAAPAPTAAAARPAVTPPASDTPAALPQTAEEQTDLKVRTMEERVSDLKEKVFRTKARLMNLQELVIGGDITTGAKAVLIHRNQMGSSFYLESVTYALDGAPIYTKVDLEGDLDKREEFEVFNGRIVPGNHQLAVQMVFRGHGYGVFSYLQEYKFKTQSSYTIDAEPGKVITVKVVGYEKGGFTSELKDRPAIKYEQEIQREEPLGRKPAAAQEGARK